MNSVEILGARVNPVTKTELLDEITRSVTEKKPSHFMLAMNPIKVIVAQRNPVFREYLSTATCLFPDAIGIVLALRLLKGIKIKRIPGFELMFDILEIANQHSLKVTLIGATPPSLAITEQKLKADYPNVRFVGNRHGYFANGQEREQAINDVIANNPDILFVGMGAIKQEALIVDIRKRKAIPFCMTVGGSFDVISRHSPRAPQWLCAIGFEWLYRLIRQPFRWRAMLPLPVFAVQVMQTYLKNKWVMK